MKFVTKRETLLRPLQLVSGVVERRQTLPILSNVLMESRDGQLYVTATDLEMEVIAKANVAPEQTGSITVPVRKLTDTCKALPDNADVSFDVNQEKALLRSGRTRFSLTTIAADEFPVIDVKEQKLQFTTTQNELKTLIDNTQFAMALQDVRFYLNGLLLEIGQNQICAVATDGHRLALSKINADIDTGETIQAIVPRKAVTELARLMEHTEDPVTVSMGENYIRFELQELTFTSKLIDGKYPNYSGVIPKGGDNVLISDKNLLKQCLVRTSILSNEKYRGIRLELENSKLKAMANNPEQEEAEDEIEVQYDGGPLIIGFNVNYLVDAISAVKDENVKMTFTDANGSALITPLEGDSSLYVVMPMRL